ncbi:hypothetical protein H4R18_002178 [Coemansia javaensis]|uniref:Uncharacterized protein n=1 Tax=Coemansia javaensis TaxID=2761396 RepID=A0A9W8HDP7_9FUNG|nr:hypothetical protein H4R18_002178 [Coemansia javaensis]
MYSDEEFESSSDYYSLTNSSDGGPGGYNSGRGDNVSDFDENDYSDGAATPPPETAAPDTASPPAAPTIEEPGGSGNSSEDGEEEEEEEEDVIEISSRTHGVPSPGSLMQFTVPGAVAGGGGTQRRNVEVEVVSLARYTFADPVLAAQGPAPLEPPVERSLIGIDALQLRGPHPVGRHSGDEEDDDGAMAPYGGGGRHYYDHDGVIADFTEERNNRRLARIARQLLLPDSYVGACYDLHEFMATEGSSLAIEAVQRNVFKCLKICARLSKLQGYSIQHMWQVIQQAHARIAEFTPPRANTIAIWHTKLSGRIRMMAISPAADGSAPQRLPSLPPPELLNAQARDKLLPLPELSVSALNDARFNRAAGASGSSYYLANPIGRQANRIAPPAAEPPAASELPPIGEVVPMEAGSDMAMQVAAEASLTLPRPLGLAGAAPEPTVEEPDALALTSQQQQQANQESLLSTREAELAIIEHQLEELEQMPPHRMGPMLRAALNLLVEMRFRLRLGLPRSSLTEENPLTAPRRIPLENSGSRSAALARAGAQGDDASETFGDGALSEERVIEYVLNRISTTRRNQAQMAGANPAVAGGAPLYMLQHHVGLFGAAAFVDPRMQGIQSQPYRDTAPRSELRRRRDTDSTDGEEDDDPEPDSDAASRQAEGRRRRGQRRVRLTEDHD